MASQKQGILAAKKAMGLTNHFTNKEVAEMVGVSPDTIRRWRIAGYVKTKQVMFGRTMVHLFDMNGVERAKQLTKEMRPGRPFANDGRPKVSHPRGKLRGKQLAARTEPSEIEKRRKNRAIAITAKRDRIKEETATPPTTPRTRKPPRRG